MILLTHYDIINTPSASALTGTTYFSVPIIDSFLDLLIYLLYLYKLSMLILIKCLLELCSNVGLERDIYCISLSRKTNS